MNLRTRTLYPHGGQYIPVDIFGYVTHGIPGIEINGMGKHGKSIKEKFVYLSRVREIKFPKRRFVICVEGEIDGKKFKDEEFRYLELPMLLILWSLSGHLPFFQLNDCFTSGKVSIDGSITCLEFKKTLLENLKKLLMLEDNIALKIISTDDTVLNEEFYHLSLEGLWNSLEKK